MARRLFSRKILRMKTHAPQQITLLIAVVLWLSGFMDVILKVIRLPNNLGIWALIVSGLLLILSTLTGSL